MIAFLVIPFFGDIILHASLRSLSIFLVNCVLETSSQDTSELIELRRMDSRVRGYKQTSPERTKVWTEKLPKYHQNRKVPVIYYLCKNQHLEHPHFIEVPLSSPDGLYLRDVVNRLDDLRGRGLHFKYSWSSKRSYKTGYVWHDLSDDDLIVPVNGQEYILKGSEIFEDNTSGCVGPTGSVIVRDVKELPDSDSTKSRDDSSSSSTRNLKGNKVFQEDECYLSDQHPDSADMSFESRVDRTSGSGDVLSIVGYKDDKSRNAADASTQTEEYVIVPRAEYNSTQSSSEESLGSSKREFNKNSQHCISLERQNYTVLGNGPVPSSPIYNKLARRKTCVTEFLNKADAKKIDSFRIEEEVNPRQSKLRGRIPDKDAQMSSSPRLKVTDMLVQLISCGSIPVKGHSFGVAHSNRPRFANLNSPSPWYSSSIMPEESSCLSDDTRLMSMHIQDKEYPIGSASKRKTGSNVHEGLISPTNSGRSIKQADPIRNKNEPYSQNNISLSESMRSALSVRSRVSTNKSDTLQNTSGGANNSSKRILYSPKKSPSYLHLSENEDVITTEERLPSGARVIIHSRATLDIAG